MAPTYNRGDVLFYAKADNFKADDIIIHETSRAPSVVRIIEINDDETYKTKGDNNLEADGGYKFTNKTDEYDYVVIEYNSSEVIYISETEVLGIVIFKIPYVGYIKLYFPVIFGILIGILIFYLIVKLFNYEIKIVKVQNIEE